ncbi:MAG: fluoride efflux transporter CrcB [Bdellovibrionales bacterium]
MIATLSAIAAGGALGALARYGVNIGAGKLLGHGFPYGTLCVNVAGSLIMGVIIAGFAQIWQPPESLRVLIVTGFLGAFTTFSTFSLDVATLWERSDYTATAVYLIASVTLSIAALFGGIALVRMVPS